MRPTRGSLSFRRSGVASGALTWDDADRDLELASLDTLRFAAGGSARIWVDAGGYTGVGTSAPGRRLSIEDGGGAPQVRIGFDGSAHADLYTLSNGRLRLSPTGRTVEIDTGDSNGGNLIFTKSGGVESGRIAWDTSDQDVTLSGERDVMISTGGSARLSVSAAGSVSLGSGVGVSAILDEDDMASDSASALATQQSIRAYVTARWRRPRPPEGRDRGPRPGMAHRRDGASCGRICAR